MHTPSSIDILNKAMASLGLTPEKIKATGITNIQLASGRTMRFDLPDGKHQIGAAQGAAKVNRVKLTAREDGTVDVRLIEVIEHELIGGIDPDNMSATLDNLIVPAFGAGGAK